MTLTAAERKALIKKHGKGYLQALDGEDEDEDESDVEGEDVDGDDATVEGETDNESADEEVQANAEDDEGSDDSDEEEHYLKSSKQKLPF